MFRNHPQHRLHQARRVAALGRVSLLIAASFGFLFLPVGTVRAQTDQIISTIPDHLAYQHLFRHVLALKRIADHAAAAGQDRSSVRSLIAKQAGLNETEGQLLENEAQRCATELDAQSAKVKAIRDEVRARYPYGILNPSLPAPTPDPRLHEMQLERNSTVLLCRDELRNVLGEDSFARLDNWVKTKTAPNVIHGIRPRGKQPVAH